MINYNSPITFEQSIMAVLEGIFLDHTQRKEVYEHIIDEVRSTVDNHNISSIQKAITEILYKRIVK